MKPLGQIDTTITHDFSERTTEGGKAMLLKRLVIAVTAGSLLVLVGCGKEESDKRLIEISVRQKKQQGDIDRIATMIEGIDKRLGEIETRREDVSASSSPRQVTFRETPEYDEIARTISGMQQQLYVTQDQLAETQESIEHQETEQFVDRAETWKAMGTPQELVQRLDILAEKFTASIGDPTLTEQFAADVERLKSMFSAPRTPQQERQMARIITTAASRMMSHDETSQQWLGEQVKALDEAADPREVDARVNVTLELWKAWEVSQLAQRHSVPPEMMEECGLTMSPEAWSYVPQELTQGVGITPSP
jgi:hypothetical protein